MGAKILTLTLKDQNLLRVALNRAIEWEALKANNDMVTADEVATTARIEELKARLV